MKTGRGLCWYPSAGCLAPDGWPEPLSIITCLLTAQRAQPTEGGSPSARLRLCYAPRPGVDTVVGSPSNVSTIPVRQHGHQSSNFGLGNNLVYDQCNGVVAGSSGLTTD
ncbi:unnamed protein product [Pleuronectes platessa]|uniref:Uncharacterized protein n=1 Tax=Pleuronectes platessa TaxID=8262 RepID=A0A9N7VU08_PLEPL|nr:unnamed protein product [Pleuronectes platessa]